METTLNPSSQVLAFDKYFAIRSIEPEAKATKRQQTAKINNSELLMDMDDITLCQYFKDSSIEFSFGSNPTTDCQLEDGASRSTEPEAKATKRQQTAKINNSELLVDMDDTTLFQYLEDSSIQLSSGSTPTTDCQPVDGAEKPVNHSDGYQITMKPFHSNYPPTPNLNTHLRYPPNPNRFVYGQPELGDITDLMPNKSNYRISNQNSPASFN